MTSKLIIAILVVVIISIITAAAIFATQTSPEPMRVESGLKAGDIFTFSIKGYSSLGDPNATTPENFLQVNMTDYYRVTITSVSDQEVAFNTTWLFTNGTQIDKPGRVNIATGKDSQEFWAIYAANITKNDLVRPFGSDGAKVNRTEPRTYKDGSRETNLLSIQTQFYDANDPTYTKTYQDYTYVYFDKQTGMLVELINMKIYIDPQIILTVEWKLEDSNVWAVS